MTKTEAFNDQFEQRFQKATIDMRYDRDNALTDVEVRKHNRARDKEAAKRSRNRRIGGVLGVLAAGTAVATMLVSAGRETVWDGVHSFLSDKTEQVHVKPALITEVQPDGQVNNPKLVDQKDMTPAQLQEARSLQSAHGVYSESQPK